MSATTDMTNPAIVPIAKSNQNTSEGPSKRKGTRPMTEDTIVRNNPNGVPAEVVLFERMVEIRP